MIWLKPHSELSVALDALAAYEGSDVGVDIEGPSPTYATMVDVYNHCDPLDVHPALTYDDLLSFIPMLHELEQRVGVPLDHDDLWYLHSVLDWYLYDILEEDSWVVRAVYDVVTAGVAALDRPPY